MKYSPSATSAQDLLGNRIAKILDDNTDLSYEVAERLRAARTRALNCKPRRKFNPKTAWPC